MNSAKSEIYIVTAHHGQYEEYTCWIVGSFGDQAEAERFSKRAAKQAIEVEKRYRKLLEKWYDADSGSAPARFGSECDPHPEVSDGGVVYLVESSWFITAPKQRATKGKKGAS